MVIATILPHSSLHIPFSATFLLDFLLIACFSVVFVVAYPAHMYVAETYLATVDTHFAFMAVKYCLGCVHLVLTPLAILAVRTDIRRAALDVLAKRSAQGSDQEVTFEQLQTHVGIGVNPGAG